MEFTRSGIITILVIVSVLAIATAFTIMRIESSSESGSDAGRVLSDGDSGTAFTDLSGEPISLEQFNGRIRVVNSWASWCPFCVEELPDLARLAAEYDEEEVVVISINRKEPAPRAQRFLDSLGESTAGIVFVQDERDTFHRSIGGFTMPETVFYDENGNITFHKRGFMELDEMRMHTKDALAGAVAQE